MKGLLISEITVIPIVFGSRLGRPDDIHELACYRPFRGRYPFRVFHYFGRHAHDFETIFKRMEAQIFRVAMKEKANSLVIFIILNNAAARESGAWISFMHKVSEWHKNAVVYLIVWDSEEFYQTEDGTDPDYLCQTDKAVRMYFDSDAPTAGARRVSEFIFRLMGCDLGVNTFPDYDTNTIRKMAQHINCENFNVLRHRERSVPKYPIRNGEPYFPALWIMVPCPACGKEKTVYRGDLDAHGGVYTECCIPERHVVYLESVFEKFDPWPEAEQFIKADDIVEV